MKTKTLIVSMLILVSLSVQGCAAFMAARQPGKKDIGLFKEGTARSILLAEFGSPVVSEEKDGKKREIFTFIQGYSGAAKAGRALFHGVADVYTWGLWEVIGTPAEGTFDGTEMAYEVTYNDDERVDSVVLLKQK